MLEMRPSCERCDINLPPDAPVAMICSFECTFCKHCATGLLSGTCPNCGGHFTSRPVRPVALLDQFPATTTRTYKPA